MATNILLATKSLRLGFLMERLMLVLAMWNEKKKWWERLKWIVPNCTKQPKIMSSDLPFPPRSSDPAM
jgi:hypothetical protein